jgi:hypothetical protein
MTLAEYLQSGTVTVALLAFVGRYLWSIFVKNADKVEAGKDKQIDELVAAVNRLSENISGMHIRFVEDRAITSTKLAHMESSLSELKLRVHDDVQVNVSKLNDKTTALFDIINQKRALR